MAVPGVGVYLAPGGAGSPAGGSGAAAPLEPALLTLVSDYLTGETRLASFRPALKNFLSGNNKDKIYGDIQSFLNHVIENKTLPPKIEPKAREALILLEQVKAEVDQAKSGYTAPAPAVPPDPQAVMAEWKEREEVLSNPKIIGFEMDPSQRNTLPYEVISTALRRVRNFIQDPARGNPDFVKAAIRGWRTAPEFLKGDKSFTNPYKKLMGILSSAEAFKLDKNVRGARLALSLFRQVETEEGVAVLARDLERQVETEMSIPPLALPVKGKAPEKVFSETISPELFTWGGENILEPAQGAQVIADEKYRVLTHALAAIRAYSTNSLTTLELDDSLNAWLRSELADKDPLSQQVKERLTEILKKADLSSFEGTNLALVAGKIAYLGERIPLELRFAREKVSARSIFEDSPDRLAQLQGDGKFAPLGNVFIQLDELFSGSGTEDKLRLALTEWQESKSCYEDPISKQARLEWLIRLTIMSEDTQRFPEGPARRRIEVALGLLKETQDREKTPHREREFRMLTTSELVEEAAYNSDHSKKKSSLVRMGEVVYKKREKGP